MALKVRENGFIEIRSDKDAVEAITAFKKLKDELDELREESGVNDLEKDLVAYKAAVGNYMKTKGRKQIQAKGFHVTLVETFDGHWDVALLRKALKKKFPDAARFKEVWNMVTKREVDAEKLDEAVAEEILKPKDIQKAWVEVPRTPYPRIFEDK